MHVVATAGHVDHGKSTLVRAMTGMDPDRFAEEKARGLTIDLGFAWCTLPSGREVSFVDVPGHVRFLSNMIAGVGAVDACLFVVAATEGWRQQSEEHLRILEMLGVADGVVAVTKCSLASEDDRTLVRMDLEDRLRGSFLERAIVVEVDALRGEGVADLLSALDSLTGSLAEPASSRRPRLWIDRSFFVRGAGTVVTGTLSGGDVSVNERLEVVPGPTANGKPLAVRVRGIQSNMRSLETVGHGRAALNLVGASHDELRRGQAVVVPGQWEPTSLLDATLVVLPSLDHEVSRRGAYRAYVGSGQFVVRLRLLQKDSLEPGEEGLVRFRLSRRLPLVPGDRYLLREMGRGETVGGGEVLDVQPLLPASRAAPDMRVARVVAERGFVEADLLERLTGVRMSPDLGGRWVADPAARTSAEERIGSALAEAGPLGLDLAVLGELDRAVLAEMDTVVVSAGRARPVDAGAEPLSRHRYVVALEDSLFSPPAPSAIGVDPAELRELVRQGIVVRSGECYFSPIAMEKAARVVAELLAASPAGVSASALREALGTTRKYVLPILAHLDATGMTRRRGDLRVAGPRLAVG